MVLDLAVAMVFWFAIALAIVMFVVDWIEGWIRRRRLAEWEKMSRHLTQASM